MRHFIGIDLGGTNIAAGLVREDGQLLAKCSLPTGAGRPTDDIVSDLVRTANLCLEGTGLKMADISGLGVGVPGAVDDARGLVVRTTNLSWHQLPLARLLNEMTGLPVRLGNDADCAALGEVCAGCAGDFSSAVMITIGTGIGGGFVHNKKVFAGWSGAGTEPGHIPLVFDGELCGCGCRGCFEAYASANALIRQTRQAMEQDTSSLLWQFAPQLDAVTAKTPFDAAAQGDETARVVLDRYLDYLARGIGGIVNLFRPEAVIIGGGVSAQGEVLLAPLQEKLKQYCYAAQYIPIPRVFAASLGNDAGIIGAGLLHLEG